MVIKVETTN